MQFAYHIVDVFSSEPFGGNQLAVLTDARGLSARGMQRVAREFSFAETTFVLPPEKPAHTAQVRIFTPAAELAFAGHPTIGTAAVLVRAGLAAEGELVLEEGIGPVRVTAGRKEDALHAALTLDGAPEMQSDAPAIGNVAEMLSLPTGAVRRSFFASYGLPFLFAHLVDAAAVDHARLDRLVWTRVLGATAFSRHIFLFAGELAAASVVRRANRDHEAKQAFAVKSDRQVRRERWVLPDLPDFKGHRGRRESGASAVYPVQPVLQEALVQPAPRAQPDLLAHVGHRDRPVQSGKSDRPVLLLK